MAKFNSDNQMKFAYDWTDDKIHDTGIHKSSSGCVLGYTPDTLYVGYGRTLILATKNRVCNRMILPDFQSVMFDSTISSLINTLSQCGDNREEFRLLPPTEDELSPRWGYVDIEGKQWGVAPVDDMTTDINTCNLETLTHYSLPVLDRRTQNLLNRYSRVTKPKAMESMDTFYWEPLLKMYQGFGQEMPTGFINKKALYTAKHRLIGA